MINYFFDFSLFLDEFVDLFLKDGLQHQGLWTNCHHFCVAFDHFDSTLMTVQIRSLLFLLESCLFLRVVGTNSLEYMIVL
jgi:hypothetical protein